MDKYWLWINEWTGPYSRDELIIKYNNSEIDGSFYIQAVNSKSPMFLNDLLESFQTTETPANQSQSNILDESELKTINKFSLNLIFCKNHNKEIAEAVCSICKKSLCPECIVLKNNEFFCAECVNKSDSSHSFEKLSSGIIRFVYSKPLLSITIILIFFGLSYSVIKSALKPNIEKKSYISFSSENLKTANYFFQGFRIKENAELFQSFSNRDYKFWYKKSITAFEKSFESAKTEQTKYLCKENIIELSLRLENYSKSINLINEIKYKYPEHINKLKFAKFEGIIEESLGNYKKAIDIYENSFLKQGGVIDFSFLLEAFQKDDQLKFANDFDNFDVYFFLGRCYFKLKKYEKANEYFDLYLNNSQFNLKYKNDILYYKKKAE